MESIHLWRVFVGMMIVISVGNLVFIDYIWLSERTRLNQTNERVNQLTQNSVLKIEETDQLTTDNRLAASSSSPSASDICSSACQAEIKKQVDVAMAQFSDGIVGQWSSPVAEPAVKPSVDTKSGIYYIPLGGTGSTVGRDWGEIPTTLTEIDWSEYGPSRVATWDAYIKVFQGNGQVSVRLFDKTNGVAVAESELSSGSETTVHAVSGPLNIWAGKNTYVVQIKSLTGYEAFFESGRIKVTVR